MDNIIEKIINKKTNYQYNYKKIKNNINISKYVKKTNQGKDKIVTHSFVKLMIATLIVIIIPITIWYALQPKKNINKDNNLFNTSKIHYNQNAVANAAIKAMDANKSNSSLMSSSSKISYPKALEHPMSDIYVGDDGYLKVTYPFTGVSIDSAYEFYVTVPKNANDFVTMNCGEGTLRVIVANFTLYDGLWPALNDEVILVVIGEKGMQHCLSGGGPGDVEFSMHKYLSGTNVEKDLKYEGYGFSINIREGYTIEYDLMVTDKDNGKKTYNYIERSYAESEGGIFYDITEICLPYIDATIMSFPENYGQLDNSKKFLVNYQTTDSNGEILQYQLIIILTDETIFEDITLDEFVLGKSIRIEFKNKFIIIDNEWMLSSIRIIKLD